MYSVGKLSGAKCGIQPSEPHKTELIFSTWKHMFQSVLATCTRPAYFNWDFSV